MTALANRKPQGSAVAAPAPRVSPYLAKALDDRMNPHPDAPPAPAAPWMREEAARLLPMLEARMEPADWKRWDWFLRPLIATCRNPPRADDFETFCRAAEVALATIPAHLLTGDRRAEACRRFAFFPAAADLASWLAPEASADRARIEAAKRLARETDMPGVAPLTEAEKADVIAKAKAFARDMAELAAEHRPPLKPAYLKPHHLIEARNALPEHLRPKPLVPRTRCKRKNAPSEKKMQAGPQPRRVSPSQSQDRESEQCVTRHASETTTANR